MEPPSECPPTHHSLTWGKAARTSSAASMPKNAKLKGNDHSQVAAFGQIAHERGVCRVLHLRARVKHQPRLGRRVAEGHVVCSLLDGKLRCGRKVLVPGVCVAVVVARIHEERRHRQHRRYDERHEHDGHPPRPTSARRGGAGCRSRSCISRRVRGAGFGDGLSALEVVLVAFHAPDDSRFPPRAPLRVRFHATPSTPRIPCVS